MVMRNSTENYEELKLKFASCAYWISTKKVSLALILKDKDAKIRDKIRKYKNDFAELTILKSQKKNVQGKMEEKNRLYAKIYN